MARKSGQKRQTASGGKRKTADKPKVQAAPEPASALPGQPPPGSDTGAAIPPSPPVAAELALQRRQAEAEKWTPTDDVGKMQKTVKAIQVMRLEGYSTNEIAEKLGIKPASIRQYMWIAGQKGWLSPLDPHLKAHSQLVHRAVSNAEEWLHARDARTGLPDKEFTLEALKGFGVFGTGPAQQSEQQATNILAIQITMPAAGSQLPQMREGNAGGVPAYVEGEVVNAPAPPGRQLPE